MNIHEYQAKELLAKFGIGIPAGYPATTVDEAERKALILAPGMGSVYYSKSRTSSLSA